MASVKRNCAIRIEQIQFGEQFCAITTVFLCLDSTPYLNHINISSFLKKIVINSLSINDLFKNNKKRNKTFMHKLIVEFSVYFLAAFGYDYEGSDGLA